MKLAKNFIILFSLAMLLVSQNSLMAQDEGDPAMRTVAMGSVLGGAAGALVGAALWLIDPLNPNADIANNVITGLGIGALGGLVLGALQLRRQAILPAEPSPFNAPSNEFNGRRLEPAPFNLQMAERQTQKPRLPLAQFGWSF